MRKCIPLFCLAFALLTACNWAPQKQKSETIHKVTLSTGGCFGQCPFQAIELNKDLSYHYYGGLFARQKGHYYGSIPDTLWQSVTKQLQAIHFKELDSTYNSTMDDMRMEADIRWGKNERKHITAQSASLPKPLAQIFNYILNTTASIPVEKSDVSHSFDTRIHLRASDTAE